MIRPNLLTSTLVSLFILLTITPAFADPVAAGAAGTPQYVFVPGSRQAKLVTPAMAANAGKRQGSYSGGMSLHTTGAVRSAQPTGGPVKQSASTKRQASTNKGKSYDYVDSLNVDGTTRTYRIHIPPSYDRSKPMPVVLAFHGLSMDSLSMLGLSGLNGLSNRRGFIVVYGEGLNNRWDDGIAGSGNTNNDLSYVRAILQKLPRTVNIDSRHIYACGISNGGFFAQRVACALADQIAAVAVVASSMTASTRALMTSSRTMPIVFFLGSDDPLLPWGDGRNKSLGNLGEALGLSSIGSIDSPLARVGGLLPVPEMIQFWTSHNNLSNSPNIEQLPDKNPRDGTRVKKEIYGNGDTVLYVIEGGGHTWPGALELTSLRELCGATTQDIDASELIWDFFQRHGR